MTEITTNALQVFSDPYAISRQQRGWKKEYAIKIDINFRPLSLQPPPQKKKMGKESEKETNDGSMARSSKIQRISQALGNENCWERTQPEE